MPSTERDDSRDSSERRLKHQYSVSSADVSRAIVPMWDSSDPERAPPPLPMNPSSPVSNSRPIASSAIQSAHAALTERARENAYVSTVAKRIAPSPERSLMKGAAHKRMQSLQTGNVRDLSSFLEGGSQFGSPRSPEKRGRQDSITQMKEPSDSKSSDKDLSRSATPTPSGRETPTSNISSVRPSLRRPPQSILGENTPPQSATMLALHSMPNRDVDMPLSNITNGSTALVRPPQTFDAISNQILSLTSICTNLQREMAQLSRRSKDNATDLVSLREATNSRDEDIRKSLRELVTNLAESPVMSSHQLYGGNSGLFIDNKAHNSPNSRIGKQFSLPRIPSPNSFAASFDRESLSSPSPLYTDSVASIALLEKILREMGTKEGQESLVSRLSEVSDQLARDGVSTAKKIDGLVEYIKENTTSQALVVQNGGRPGHGRIRQFSFEDHSRFELDFEHPKPGPISHVLAADKDNESRRASGAHGADIVNDDILKVIRTVKDSVSQGGGLTAEVKALVRELRGEVLGMGRDIGRKLDQASKEPKTNESSAAAEKEYLTRVIQGGLEELKHSMDRVVRENRRQSGASTVSRIDFQEIYNAVKSAVSEQPRLQQQPDLSKGDIVEAVKEAWENYKPDIEVQHFGLEREELLATLKEGIEEFAPQEIKHEHVGATREEVFTAVIEGLKHFHPPPVPTEATLSRDEVLDAVRECLEEFEFPSAPLPESKEAEITRDDMVDAVREGLHNFDFAASATTVSRDIGGTGTAAAIDHEELYNAVRSGVGSVPLLTEAFGLQISGRLQEILDTMRAEFQAVSDEARQNVSANGRDTEQVLDATKDGFDKLRADIETYVDRAADVTGKDEILESMRESFHVLRGEIAVLADKESGPSTETLMDGFEHLRETMASSLVPSGSNLDKEELLAALTEGLESLRADIDRARGNNESIFSETSEIFGVLQDGLNGLRVDVEKIGNKPVDMTVNYEILDTLKAGLESVRADIEGLYECRINDRAVAAIEGGAVITTEPSVDSLKRNDIEHLEVLITQLRIKVEAMESMPAQPVPETVTHDDLDAIGEVLRDVQKSVAEVSALTQVAEGIGGKEEVMEAIETLLRNATAKLDEMDPEQAVKKDHLDSVEVVVLETRENLRNLSVHLEDVTKREEMINIESLVRDVLVGLEEIKERAATEAEDGERVTKIDVQAVEAVCLDLKTSIETQLMADVADLASKSDLNNLGEVVKEFKDRIETHAGSNAKAFEERQAETVGVGERITELQTFLEEFKMAINEKLEEGSTGVESVGKLLENLGETINQNANVSEGVTELLDVIKSEFDKSHAGVVGSKLESDEKFQQTWDRFDEKIDDKFHELMSKYDDAQMAAEAKAAAGEEKTAESEAAMLGTKAVAEDLKLLIDTLGTTLTESVERMDEASKTVFNRVEDTFTRVEEAHVDTKFEHQLNREQVLKAIEAIQGVQEHANQYQPKILESVKDVLLMVGQHYEHSKSSTEKIQEKIAERPTTAETPLLPEPPLVEKYDDNLVHEKLDKLVDHMHVAGKSFAQLDSLDKIHQQVIQTAAEVSEFVSAQTKRIANEQVDMEKAAEAAAVALEQRLAQKNLVEVSITSLQAEEEGLEASVTSLRASQGHLAQQKMRLSTDVSSLETALRIRREELHAMEARAEGLERRILDGVIDHSRALLISKANKGHDAMSRKRVPSHVSSSTGSMVSSATSRASYATQSAVTMAMNGHRAVVSVPVSHGSYGPSRRILSLNQITGNVPTGGSPFKRSHSVKASSSAIAAGLRKSSWGGSLSRTYGELNKENLALMKEDEEEEDEDGDDDMISVEDDRRCSRGTIVTAGMGTTLSGSIDEGTEWTASVDGEQCEESESDRNETIEHREARCTDLCA